ncbi:MAG: BACON domain-containing protein [Muribaculaceae bacterium]|nr:BACON domain-containing protein [Muribaculaceae bacterium]
MRKKTLLLIVTAILSCCVCISSCKKDEPKHDILEVNPTSVTLNPSLNATGSINITCNGQWNITAKPEWINVSSISGTENSVVTITTLTENESTSSRSADLEVKCGSKSAKVQIIQSGKELEILELNPTSISLVSSANSTAQIDIKCNGAWSIVSKPEWINVSSNSGKGATSLIITAITENDSATPRSGELKIISGSTSATLLISQLASLESGCEVIISDEVILNTSATFRVNFGSKASYFFAGYFPASSAGWSDNKIVEELENSATPMNVENDTDLTADELDESTTYIQCFVAYNEKGKRGEVIRRTFKTPSSKDAPMAYISDVSYSSTKWYWSTKIGATAQEYYMLVYGGDTAFLYGNFLAPSDIAMIFKDKVKNLTSYVNSQDWNVDREAEEMDLLICTWAQRDKKWSAVLNMFYGSVNEESSAYIKKKLSTVPLKIKKNQSNGMCTPHYLEQREAFNKHFRIIKK